MIGKLRGIVDVVEEDFLLLDVGGVGYMVFCSGKTLGNLPGKGEAAMLMIETHVREDHIHLYGFANREEQECFRELIKISGIGAKVALTVLSALSPSQLALAIAAQDKAAFKGVSGVGPKLAERMLTELKGKFGLISTKPAAASTAMPEKVQANDNIADAVSALVHLGYGRMEAYAAVTKAANQNENSTVESLIKAGLKELGK